MPEERWRIDDLARRADVTVDTIRYYNREGLLPPPERQGRHKLYGPPHLDRLERIKELQERRFSLASIRALFDAGRPGIDALFAGTEHTFGLDDLVARAGVDRDLVERVRDVGLLVDPASLGRDAYDDLDLGLLAAVDELREIGMPPEVLVELGAVYVGHFDALQRDVIDLLAGRSHPEWDADALASMQARLTSNAGRLIPAVDRVLNYLHQRTLQQLTLDAVTRAREEGLGVGGRPVEDPPAVS